MSHTREHARGRAATAARGWAGARHATRQESGRRRDRAATHVSVVHVEVDHRDTLHASLTVHVARVRGADRDVVEQAKAVAAVRVVLVDDDAAQPRVVAGRSDRAERVAVLPLAHAIDGGADGARAAHRRVVRARRDRRVRVDVSERHRRAARARRAARSAPVVRRRPSVAQRFLLRVERGALLAHVRDVAVLVDAQHVRDLRARCGQPLGGRELGRAEHTELGIAQHAKPQRVLRRRLGAAAAHRRRARVMLHTHLARHDQRRARARRGRRLDSARHLNGARRLVVATARCERGGSGLQPRAQRAG